MAERRKDSESSVEVDVDPLADGFSESDDYEPETAAYQRANCALVGPPGCGKTSLVAAAGRVGLLGSPNKTQYLAVGSSAWLLRDYAASFEEEGAFRSHQSAVDDAYPFALTGETEYLGDMQLCGGDFLVLHELNCASLFAQTQREESDPQRAPFDFDRVREAEFLVLAVDGRNVQVAAWQIALLKLIGDLIDLDGWDEAVPPGESHSKGVAWLPPRRRSLPFKRVLVLVTASDVLFSQISRSISGLRRDGRSGTFDRQSALAIAHRIDPVGQAVALLGEEFFRTLLAVLSSDADLAVGFSSALGMSALSTAGIGSKDGLPRSGLSGWQPFGVGEAMDYLSTGAASGSVALVGSWELDALKQDMGTERSQMAYAFVEPEEKVGELDGRELL